MPLGRQPFVHFGASTDIHRNTATRSPVILFQPEIDSTIELGIRDHGEGFDLESLFSKESLKKGLGLSRMKERVEFSDGSFSINSVKGKGTVIRAVWPV